MVQLSVVSIPLRDYLKFQFVQMLESIGAIIVSIPLRDYLKFQSKIATLEAADSVFQSL